VAQTNREARLLPTSEIKGAAWNWPLPHLIMLHMLPQLILPEIHVECPVNLNTRMYGGLTIIRVK